MIKEIHIYDMDGTLVDSSHRYRLLPDVQKIDLKHWIKNCVPEKIAKDTLLPLAKQYQEQIKNPDIYVVIATARVIEKADMDYIKNVLGMPNKIVSRAGRNDARKGADMKIAGLRYLKYLKQFSRAKKHFYEDNKNYLYPVASFLNATPHFIPSNQGF